MNESELHKYKWQIKECADYFKDRDYILYLIFKDEYKRVSDLLIELMIGLRRNCE